MCAYLLKGGACASIYDQGCFAVYVNVGFASVFCILQFYQVSIFRKQHSECWSDLKKEHQHKRDKKRKEIEEKREKKKRADTLNRTMPDAAHIHSAHTEHDMYDKRGHGRSHSQKMKTDQKRKADVAMPKPVKYKANRGEVQHDGSQRQVRNGQAARDIGAMFSSSGRTSPSSSHTYHSGPSTVSRRGMNGTSQRIVVDEIRPPRVLVNSASFLESEHGSILSRPGGSSAPSIQRHATGAGSHKSRRRRHEHPVENVSPLSSVVESSHLTQHPRPTRSPSPLSMSSYAGRGIPDITITPCGSDRSSIIPQTDYDGHRADRSDRESLTSQNFFHPAFWGDRHGPRAG